VTKRTLPRGTGYNERAIALARHLGIEMPPEPLTHGQYVTLWAQICLARYPFGDPKPATLNQALADFGMFMAEANEPEFKWGRGRRKGDKNKMISSIVSEEGLKKRRQRRDKY
jgi:hypothetical protein